jgi:hypothetical protein
VAKVVTPLDLADGLQAAMPDISPITDAIFLSSLPKHEHADHIWKLGVRLVISMPLYRPPKVYCRPPFTFVHCPTVDSPLVPIPLFMLRRGVEAALPVIERGDNVLIHCKAGVHRSVAMTTCILIARGYTAEAAMKFVKERRPVADPYAPHIRARILAFERDWHKRQGIG